MPLFDKYLLRKRSLIETTFSVLKRRYDIENSRHRSFNNFLIRVNSALIVYQLRKNKPTISGNYAILNSNINESTFNSELNLAVAA